VSGRNGFSSATSSRAFVLVDLLDVGVAVR